MIVFFLLLLFVTCSLSEENHKEGMLEEYCQNESFHAQCLKNEVIIIQSATYGRMRMGRCVTEQEMMSDLGARNRDDPRYLGCSADVLPILNRHCSGKRTCELKVFDPELYATVTPCNPALKLYLETSYNCISVVDDDRSCTVTAASSPSHIIGSTASKIGCGTKTQPWMLEAPVGQHIQLSLLDLTSSSNGRSFADLEKSCVIYGFISEKNLRKNISICSDGRRREQDLHLSRGNSLTITLDGLDRLERKRENISFLLKIEAVGCSDIVPPEDTWLKRNDDVIVVGCYSSRQTWQLRCEGRKWIGVLGNCSHAPLITKSTREELDNKVNMPLEQEVLVIVAIGGFGFALCLVIICAGVVCLRRYYLRCGNAGQHYKSQLLNGQNETEQRRLRLVAEHDHVAGKGADLSNLLRTSTLNGYPKGSSSHPPSYSMYGDRSDIDGRNGNYNDVSRADDSVKYFVLEQDATA